MKEKDKSRLALPCLQVDEIACRECRYFGQPYCASIALKDAMARIGQLEGQIDMMLRQMRGDCGVCRHRNEGSAGYDIETNTFRQPEHCTGCLTSPDRPNWEYEGLPDVKG